MNQLSRHKSAIFGPGQYRLLIACAVWFALTGTVAAGESDRTALELYEAGEYGLAVTKGRAEGSADSLALAARARLIMVRFFDAPPDRLVGIEAALNDARQALALDPGHLEGNLQMAVGIGYRGRLRRSVGDAKRSRRYIDNALSGEPENGWAKASLGGWNAEVVMEAGTLLGRIIFGARRSLAIKNFRAAVAAEPSNVTFYTGFAKVLLRFGKKKYREEAVSILTIARALVPRHAFEAMMQKQAGQLLSAIEEGREDDLEKLLERMAPFSDD